MPYASNDELPKSVRGKLSEHQQSVFRNVFNSMLAQEDMTESRAFAGAWSQAKGAVAKAEYQGRDDVDFEVAKKSCRMWESDTSVSELTNKVRLEGKILKQLDEERLAFGWAYVSTVKGELSLDHSGEFIRPDQIAKAATNFMLSMRTAKRMHSGERIGEVVHSMPLTDDIAKALGIETDRQGWIVAVKVHDDAVWQDVKSGRLSAFSIGGRALKEMV